MTKCFTCGKEVSGEFTYYSKPYCINHWFLVWYGRTLRGNLTKYVKISNKQLLEIYKEFKHLHEIKDAFIDDLTK